MMIASRAVQTLRNASKGVGGWHSVTVLSFVSQIVKKRERARQGWEGLQNFVFLR